MKKFVCVIMITACTLGFIGCSNKTAKPEETCVLKWVYPGRESDEGSREIYQRVNDIIQEKYPHIEIDFEMINFNEYSDRIEMYNASKEKIDLVWGSDFTEAYYNDIYSQGNKLALDEPIRKHGKELSAMFSDITENSIDDYKYNNKLYCLPNSLGGSGLIPYLKIPYKYKEYFDCNALSELLSDGNVGGKALYEIIDLYLSAVSHWDKRYTKIDYYSLVDILPRVGYKSVISTYDLLGYEISKDNGEVVCLKNTESYKQFLNIAKKWQNEGMIPEDIDILYANNTLYGGDYLLDAGWGYYENNHFYSFADDIYSPAHEYYYIPLGNIFYTNNTARQGITYVHSRSDHKVEAIKVLTLFYSNPELYRLLTYGIEGRDYTVSDDYVTRKGYLTYGNVFPHYGDTYYDIPDSNVMNLSVKERISLLDNLSITSEDAFYWLDLYNREYNNSERTIEMFETDMTGMNEILDRCNRR